jgi:hypothetical protein
MFVMNIQFNTQVLSKASLAPPRAIFPPRSGWN